MSYVFRRDQKVRKGVRRIARKELERGVAALGGHASARERVHEARTSLKKLRGLLRLVGPALGKRARGEEDRLRALGKTLSGLRDAEVMVQTFDAIFDHFERQLGSSLRRVRTRLNTRLRRQRSRLDLPARLREVANALRKAEGRTRRWAPHRGGWRALRGGLRDTYRWGRRSLARAYRSGGDDAFHEWRKAVKYHGYHIRLLAEVWPEGLDRRRELVEQLGALLGEDHDLALFGEVLRREPACFDDERDREVLLGLVEQRQQALRTLARPLGRKLFAEKPRAFERRLRRYWRVWRSTEEARAEELEDRDAAAA